MSQVRRVFLVGYMGSGKSTIGRYIASDMGWQFVDMDSYFEQKHQTTISDFFAAKGEAEFRKAEAAIVHELCQLDNVVVATGGGAPCFADNMQQMNRAGVTIYIYVEPIVLAQRLFSARAHRPLLADKTDEELLSHITRQLAEREPHYKQARMTVDGDRLPFSQYKMFIEAFDDEDLRQ